MNLRPPARRLWGWAIGVATVLVIVIAALALRRPAGIAVSTAVVTRRDVLAPILCDGSLEPPPGGELRAQEPATVAAIPAREGSRVAKGDVLVRLENPDLTESALRAQAAALELSDDRTKASADLESARREAAHARDTVDADRRLLRQSAIPRATYETDQLAAVQADNALKAAQSRFDSIAGSANGSRLALAKEQARQLEQRVAALTLRAPAAGVAYGLPSKTGATVSAGQIVAGVADPAHLRVRARVDQPDLPRVAVGQRLLVTFDGLPDRQWEGKVSSVSAGVREEGGRQVGEVSGEISDPDLRLPPNASVNVQVVVGEKHGVLAVPRGCVLGDGVKRFVYRLESGRARRADVTIGLVGLNETEITQGLAAGETVILPGTVPLSEGLRVRVSKDGASSEN